MCPELINKSTALLAKKAVKAEEFYPKPEKEILLRLPLVVMI